MFSFKKISASIISVILFLFLSNLIISNDNKKKEETEKEKLSQPLEGKKLRDAELSQEVQLEVTLPETEEINLIEEDGAFKLIKPEGNLTVKNITVTKGVINFSIENKSKRKLSFVLDRQGAEQDDHILILILNPGEKVSHKVALENGSYSFYCPINPTPHYTLIVSQIIKK